MWSDWILGLRDPELLYKKLREAVDKLEDTAKTAYHASLEKLKIPCRLVSRGFQIAIAVTLVSIVAWFVFQGLGVKSPGLYQFLVVAVGLTWACFLTFVAVLLAIVEGIVRQFERLEKLLNDFKNSLLKWIRIPAWVAFVTLFLAVLMARFPGLRKPESFLSLVLIIAAFGLASFLGICSVNLAWLRRFVYIQFFIAVFLILIPSLLPHETAWLSRKIGVITGPIRKDAGPKQVTIDPNSPPPFFDAVTGEPLFWYSQRADGGFALWDAKGRDPDTSEELQPVRTKEMREKILSWLRGEALRKPKPVKAEPIPVSNRLPVRRAEDIVFVNQVGSNIVWFYGSQEAGYELYDAPGFHRTGARLMTADTDEIRQTILNWFRSGERSAVAAASESPKTSSKPNPGTSGDKQTPQAVQPPISSIGNSAQTTPTESKREAWREFSSEARQVIAGDLLQRDTTEFEQSFALEYLSASQSRRRFQGYNVKSDLVVVTARFRVSSANVATDGTRWTKTYDVSEIMTPDEFQGLTSANTVYRVAGALKGQIQKDKEALAVLQRKTQP